MTPALVPALGPLTLPWRSASVRALAEDYRPVVSRTSGLVVVLVTVVMVSVRSVATSAHDRCPPLRRTPVRLAGRHAAPSPTSDCRHRRIAGRPRRHRPPPAVAVPANIPHAAVRVHRRDRIISSSISHHNSITTAAAAIRITATINPSPTTTSITTRRICINRKNRPSSSSISRISNKNRSNHECRPSSPNSYSPI